MVEMPVNSTATPSIRRAPRRSSTGPINGEASAARMPPRETAPDSAARDQPKSRVIGSTKIDSVATAGPCRAKPQQHRQAKMIQP
jgi:hypothetical protein